MKPTKLRSCLEFISSLVKNYFRVDLSSLGAANSGLFARTKRAKMPKRGSNKQKSITLNTLAVKSKRILCESLAFSTHRHWNLRVLCGLCARQVTSRMVYRSAAALTAATQLSPKRSFFHCVNDAFTMPQAFLPAALNLHHFIRICIINSKKDADFSFMMQKNINFATTNKIRYAYI